MVSLQNCECALVCVLRSGCEQQVVSRLYSESIWPQVQQYWTRATTDEAFMCALWVSESAHCPD